MVETAAGDQAARDDEPEDLGTALRRRHDEIAARIGQLQERRQELAERVDSGSTSPETLQAARAESVKAQAHAQEGHVHAAQAHERAADRHAEAVELHEQVAAVLDEHGAPERARMHRQAAEADRDAEQRANQAARDE